MPRQYEPRVEVEATAKFKNDGNDVRPGERVMMSAENARDLIAAGFVRRISVPRYKDRAMRPDPR